jgi:hypothetical protein
MSERIDVMTNPFPPEVPPEFPINPPDAIGWTSVPIPVVFEEPAGRVEYRVWTLRSPESLELEEKLNDASRDGWSLFQIIRQKKDLLLVFFRQSRRR